METINITDTGNEFVEKLNANFEPLEVASLKVDDKFNLGLSRDSSIYIDNTNNVITTSATGYGTSVFKVLSGSRLKITATNSVIKTFRLAFTSGYPVVGAEITGGQYWSDTTSVDVTVTAPFDGYLCCSFGNASFSDLAVKATVFIADYAKELLNKKSNGQSTKISTLPISGVINADRKADWTTEASNTKMCTSVMLNPYYGCVLHFTLPSGVTAYVRYGNIISGPSSSTLSQAILNGGSFEIPAKNANICIIFEGSNIVEGINNGTIKIEYYNDTPNVVQKNIACESYTKAVMYKAKTTAADSYLHNIPVFAHISDIHGDMVRMRNCLDYCKYLDVDAILNSGDTVCNKGSDGCSTYNSIVSSLQIPTLVCVGNHDGWYPDYGTQTQNEKLNQDLISPNATAFGYSLAASGEYDEAPTYYYKDFDSRKIRVIVLNEYESGLYSWAYVGRISQKQIDWLISTLADTPSDYGVLLMYHASMFAVDKEQDYSKFYNKTSTYSYDPIKYLNGDPIGKIIDAFISKDSASGTYTQKNNGADETISWSADFTSLNSGVEFIAHITGHTHSDHIGLYHGTTQRQVVMNITTGQSLYGFTHYSKANNSEIPRGGHGATEDAFNVYGIDRANGEIRIARVGSNITSLMEMRDYMIIPYRQI